MEIKKIDEKELVISQRKKRNRDSKKTIFEIYKSEKTVKDYMFHLKDFLHFIYDGENDFSISEVIPLMQDIEKEDVEAYIVHLFEDRKLKKTSVNTILSALKSLYKELESNGLKNPVKYIKLFKVNRNIENVLKVSIDDIRKIIGLYKIDSEKKYRNITILYTLFYTGIRSKELLTLQFKHYLKREDEYFFKLVETKSGKDVYKPIHKSLVKKLEEYRKYLMSMYSLDIKELDEHYIFSTSILDNSPLSYRSLNAIIQDMGKLIGKDISPHNIRHAIATELSLSGADILEIRDFLGHSDTKVTEVYINARSILEKKVLEKLPEINLDEKYIFLTSVLDNTPLSYRSLNAIIQDMGKLIGKDISPHNIRHAIATELSLSGADILEIRDFLGHSDTKVTEVYINARSILEKKVLEKLPEINLDEE